ncbi:MAG: hypothetical protein FWD90_07285 [Defluviitaleaceae bacterium]|nr:hypothetical protein [Defluviitaleaceae bacterium]
MRNEIILIGAMGVGKTTTSKMLSEKLNKPHIHIDEIRIPYYEEIGYCQETANKIFKEKGFFNGMYRYWKPFELYAIKRILSEYSDCIFDFGAGHSVYEDDEMLNEAKELLMDFYNVFLLLPSEDIIESLAFLGKRGVYDDEAYEAREANKHFLAHHSNYDLCKHIIYVKGKSKDDIVNEIYTIYNAV